MSPAGHIYVVDRGSSEIFRLDTLGNVEKSIGGYGWGESSFDEPSDIFASTLNVYVADKNNDRIQFLDRQLNFLSHFKNSDTEPEERRFAYPTCFGISVQGDMYILDSDNQRIIKYTLSGEYQQDIGNYEAGEYALSAPLRFAISPSGRIYVINREQIFIYDQYGAGISKLDTGFEPENINIRGKYLLLNDENTLVILDLWGKRKPIKFTPGEREDEPVIDAEIFNNKLYILLESNILVYDSKLLR